jgi:hypothetical protein
MYPVQVLALFPPFPRENKVFVAMSFDPRFDARWNYVIKPGITAISINDEPLEAYRVDVRQVSDSIMTDILQGISRCRLILADITMLGKRDNYTIRNGNVMYEVGLTHAARQPEEVLLFRSDNEPLLFDVASIRVNTYDPDGDTEASTRLISHAVYDALREIDLKKSLVVQRAVESLRYDGFMLLMEVSPGLSHPAVRTMGEVLGFANKCITISRLLDVGMISTKLPQFAPETFSQIAQDQPMEQFFAYELTPFGEAVRETAAARLGFTGEAAMAWNDALGEELENKTKPPPTGA